MVTDLKKRIDLSELLREAADPAALAARSERYYRDQMRLVADMFCETFPENRVILLAGPSSAGKTTTSLNIERELQNRGFHTLKLSLDDFFKPRNTAPLLEDGTPDLETVELIDMELLDDCFEKLFETGVCHFPIYDFAAGGRSEKTNFCQMDDHTVIIIEGLHALNPLICERHFCEKAVKLYISIKTEFYDGDTRLLSTRQLRQIRRIIRDVNFRATSPADTMAMWKNVVRGEDRYIRPFRLGADFWIDSVHLYEPFLYRPIFWEITENQQWHQEIHRETVDFLRRNLAEFSVISTKYVPQDSLLREFIILP